MQERETGPSNSSAEPTAFETALSTGCATTMVVAGMAILAQLERIANEIITKGFGEVSGDSIDKGILAASVFVVEVWGLKLMKKKS